ncbi:MAG: hypothetical protein R3C14_49510 [Caldilineaceae bacterium]
MDSTPSAAARAVCRVPRLWRLSKWQAGAGLGALGDVQWGRNLRAAGCATITVRRRKKEVRAVELDLTECVAFFRDILGPLARSIPFGIWFIRVVDGVDLNRPLEVAEGRRVFELLPFQ